jgi:hypothetical protein
VVLFSCWFGSGFDKSFLYVNTESDAVILSELNARIKSAFPTMNSNFNATSALVATVVLTKINKNATTLIQMALCINPSSVTFLIVSYAQMDIPPKNPVGFYEIPLFHANATFQVSDKESNCGVPGQFIFQFVNQAGSVFVLFLKIVQDSGSS